MKKSLLVFSTFSIVLSLASCGLFTDKSVEIQYPSNSVDENITPEDSTQVQLSKQEEIYQMAKASGYQGSYEQWLNSIKGESIELAIIDNAIQWKYTSSSTWTKLIDLNDLKGLAGEKGETGAAGEKGETGAAGTDGKTPEFRVLDGYLQYRYKGESDSSWVNLCQMTTSTSYDTITVTFDPNNGEATFTQPVIPGYNIAEPEEIENKGYIFEGWYYEDTNDEWKFNYYSTSKDITLKAKWSIDYNYIPELDFDSTYDESLSNYVSDVETVEINVWATAAEEQVINELVAKWNSEHDASHQFKINYKAVSEDDCGMYMNMHPDIEGAPALFLAADLYTQNLLINDMIVEVSPTSTQKIVKNNLRVAAKGVEDKGRIYGYPITTNNGYFMWYDKSQVSVEKVSSLEGLLAHAKALGKSVLMDVPNGWYANSFLMSPQACGTESLQVKYEDYKYWFESNWDNETGAKVSEYIQKLLTPYYNDGTLITGANTEIQQGFADRTLIAAVSGTWMETDLYNEIGDSLAATKMPSYVIDNQTYQMSSFAGSQVYYVNKKATAEQQKTAAALAELLTTKEAQKLRHEKREVIPCDLGAFKELKDENKIDSVGGTALFNQSMYASVQAKCTANSYWDIGRAIGQTYIYGQLNGYTWSQFLTEQMNLLREKYDSNFYYPTEVSLYVIGSHWNNWDVSTVDTAEGCEFTSIGDGTYQITLDITEEMVEEYVGFKFVQDNTWNHQLGMEDVDWYASNEEFRNLFPDGKLAFQEPYSNRSNFTTTVPGQLVITYNPLNNVVDGLWNGSTHTYKLIFEFYPYN